MRRVHLEIELNRTKQELEDAREGHAVWAVLQILRTVSPHERVKIIRRVRAIFNAEGS